LSLLAILLVIQPPVALAVDLAGLRQGSLPPAALVSGYWALRLALVLALVLLAE
jgi:hypothetical protein